MSVPCRACAWVDEVHGSCGFTLSQGRAATVDTPTATSPRLTVAKAAATAQTPTSPGHLWSISSSVRHFANTERHISKNKIKPPPKKVPEEISGVCKYQLRNTGTLSKEGSRQCGSPEERKDAVIIGR